MEIEQFNVDLLEQNSTWYFSVDHKNQQEYLYKKRSGLLQRKINTKKNAARISNSFELGSLSEAKPLISGSVTAAALKVRDKDKDIRLLFHPDKILRANEYILDSLRHLNPMEWKIIFRAIYTGRVIIKKGCKEKKSDFTYFSILIKLRLKDQRDFIEIGEGSVQALKFNQDGLSSRLKKIAENHKVSTRAAFEFTDKVPVILNSGDGAILFHEILGHSLEADYIYHGQAPISPADIGKPIVSKNVTLVTAYPGDTFFKGISCDDEGEAIKPLTLVEKGVLRHLISDGFYKQRLNIEDCGHCRVGDFTKTPLPRMYALYLEPGEYHPEELISSTPYGVYAEEFGDGKVFFHKDLFYFHIREAWLIEKGKLSAPLGSIVVRGNIREVLNSVDMVANDFRYDKGISYCFKNSQTLNVRVGQPTVKISNLYITKETII
jgi:predicted Zn-dependent protease